MESLIYSIDTKLIEKNNSSNFKYSFSEKINNVVNITLSSVEIPNSIYVFNDTKDNEVFRITVRGYNHRFYLQQGNYDIKELYDQILFFFNTIEKLYKKDGYYIQFNFSFDIDNARFKLECNETFSLFFDNLTKYDSLGRQLGFAQDKYENIRNITGEYIPDIMGDKYIFMKMNDYGNIYNNDKKYFSKIIINKESYEMIYNSQHKFISKTFKFNQPTELKELDFRFEDYMGNLVNFNGLDLSFTLEIKFIKNIGLKPFYEKYNYDEELMRMILMDSMMNYYLSDDFKLPMLDVNTFHKLNKQSKEDQ
tara:strand:+ start:10318 stop:11241 length:924 start_codon:yes stop_codon:yes gene_type:complete